MITVQNLQKHFKLNKQYRGAWGSVRTLFSREYEVVKAVDDISFTVARGEVLVLNDNFCVRISEILEAAVHGADVTD